MRKVIVSLAYNRPECEKQCLKHLENCVGIENYTVFFFVEPCDCEVIDIIAESKLNKKIIVNTKLLGLWKNKLQAINYGIRESDFVICVEDDVLLARDALEYFEWANKTFEQDKTIKTVTAYNNLMGEPYHQELSHRIQKRHWYNSTAWAIWKDRYEQLNNWTGEDKNLMNQLFESSDSYEVFPILSRAQNIGYVNGVKSPAKEVLSVVGLENSYATIGLSKNATKDNIIFVEDKESYHKSLLNKLDKTNTDKVIIEQTVRCYDYTFENQLIVNELGQECIKLDDNNYKSRDNDYYKYKYYLDVWHETINPEKKEFWLA